VDLLPSDLGGVRVVDHFDTGQGNEFLQQFHHLPAAVLPFQGVLCGLLRRHGRHHGRDEDERGQRQVPCHLDLLFSKLSSEAFDGGGRDGIPDATDPRL